MNTQIIYYWQSGAWTDDAETAALAVEYLKFSPPGTVELDIEADVDSKLAGLIPEPVTV